MRIIRYFRKRDNRIGYAARLADGPEVDIDGDVFWDYQLTDRPAEYDKILSPVAPLSILCVGLNYKKHAEETKGTIPDYPVLFMKSFNAVQNPDDPIVIPTHLKSERVDYEGELAVVIGKICKNVSREHALDYVLGYTCSNDVSARDWQIKYGGSQWCRGKTFDTFCPIGPCLVTLDEIPNPNNLSLRTVLNGQTMQDCNTSDMIFDIPALIEFFSGSTTLFPGTIILTGTPHGVGMAREPRVWLKEGDTVSVEIENIGTLTNPVINESE